MDKNKNGDLEKVIYDKLTEVRNSLLNLINDIKDINEKMNKNQLDIPNTATTASNKLTELRHIIQNKGLSFYYTSAGNDGKNNISYLADAITLDLIDKLNKSYKKLKEYVEEQGKIYKKKESIINNYKTANVFKKFFIRNTKPETLDINIDEKEEKVLKEKLEEYKKIDQEIFEYDIEKNIVDALVKYIIENNYSASDVPLIIDTCISPQLEEWNLTHLVPELKEKLVVAYKEQSNQMNISEEHMNLFVPDFSNSKDETSNIKK